MIDYAYYFLHCIFFFEHYVEITLFIGFEKFEKKKETLEDGVVNYLLYPLIFLLF